MLFFRPPTLPRHPLARLLWIFIGLGLSALLFLFGLFIAAVVLGVGILAWLLRQLSPGLARPATASATPRPTPSNIIEGEFVVIERDRKPLS